MQLEITEVTQKRLMEVCRKYYVQKLSVFGSTLHGEARAESDLDILVEFIPDKVPGFFTFVGLQDELSAVLNRKIDLRTPQDLSKYFRDTVVAEARQIYAIS